MISANLLLLSVHTWWHSISGWQQLLWTLALVSTFLSLLFLILYFTGVREDSDSGSNDHTRTTRWTLLGFTAGSWAGVLSSWFTAHARYQLLIAFATGILAVLFRWWLFRRDLKKQAAFDIKQALAHTGRVLKSIPPNQAGTGKVHLDLRSAPYELEAVTMGEQIRPGQYIRVVEIVEGRLIRVEPLPSDPPESHRSLHGRGK